MSIQEVAQIAGVPYATTWRVINQSPGVSAEAITAVRKAMEQTGYTVGERRRNGRGTARPKHRNIALLHLRAENALSVSMVRAVQRIAHLEGLNLIFSHVNGREDLPPAMLAGEVDGVLGYGVFPETAMSPDLRDMPAVWMMSPPLDAADTWGDRVMPDHRAIGHVAANYLLDRGHKHLAYLAAAGPSPFFTMRGDAFALTAHGRAKSVQIVKPDAGLEHDDPRNVSQVVERWAGLSPRPTGIFVPHDYTAVGICALLQERGVKLGRGVEVISCNNQKEDLSRINPPPASIDLNRDTIARLAVERLLWRIREGASSPPVRIVVSPTLPRA
jgi:DNA-binding LacI/PurR family transcriptional regulator